jgi:hypothetical protein
MKRVVFIIISFLMINPIILKAQENVPDFRNGKIGITYSPRGIVSVFRFNEDAAFSSYGDFINAFGISYVHSLNNWLEAETGIEYSRYQVWTHYRTEIDHLIFVIPHKVNFSLINIPVTFRVNFLRYFFINSGLIIDIDASSNSPIHNQTGIGTLLGLSLKRDFDTGVSSFVNVYTKIHSHLPFIPGGEDKEVMYHQRIHEFGIRFGITYDLRKKL